MIYLFTGDDEWQIEQAVQKLVEQHQVPFLSYRRLRYMGDAEPLLEALVEASTLTLDGSTQLLWLQGLPLNGPQNGGVAVLLAGLEGDAEQTGVLVLSGSQVDARTTLGKRLKGVAETRHYPRSAPWETAQAADLVYRIARTRGLNLSQQIAAIVVEQTGSDGHLIEQAVEVLALHRGPFTPELITRLVPAQTSRGIEFVRGLLNRDVAAAQRDLEQAMALNEPPLRLLALCLSQMRLWLGVKAATAQYPEADNGTIARMIELSGNPNRVYHLKQEVRAVSLEQLYGLMRLVIATEKAIKTGSREDLAMQQLVLAVGRVR